MSLTDEDKFFQREEVKDVLISRAKSDDKGLTIDFEISADEIMKLIKICQEDTSFQVPSGLTREERRQWALNKIAQEDAMNEIATLSEDLGLYDTNSVTVVSDNNLMTNDKFILPDLDREGMRNFILNAAKEG